MVSQTVDKIILIEKQAAEKEAFAHMKSEQIISEANEKAQEIIAEATCESKMETAGLIQRNITEINEIIENNNNASLSETAKIKTNAQDRKEKAINIVIDKIISR